jgi:hypothetical protein
MSIAACDWWLSPHGPVCRRSCSRSRAVTACSDGPVANANLSSPVPCGTMIPAPSTPRTRTAPWPSWRSTSAVVKSSATVSAKVDSTSVSTWSVTTGASRQRAGGVRPMQDSRQRRVDGHGRRCSARVRVAHHGDVARTGSGRRFQRTSAVPPRLPSPASTWSASTGFDPCGRSRSGPCQLRCPGGASEPWTRRAHES